MCPQLSSIRAGEGSTDLESFRRIKPVAEGNVDLVSPEWKIVMAAEYWEDVHPFRQEDLLHILTIDVILATS